MRVRAKAKKWSQEVAESFDKDLKKLQRMNIGMADYSVHRSYLELMLDLPWDEFSKDSATS
jgi:ATP-dependent Lon protease